MILCQSAEGFKWVSRDNRCPEVTARNALALMMVSQYKIAVIEKVSAEYVCNLFIERCPPFHSRSDPHNRFGNS